MSLHLPPARAFARAAPCPTRLAWLGRDGAVWHTVRALPGGPALDAATAILARGAPLRTPDGPAMVEDLGPGDVVATSEGWARIVWAAAREARADGSAPLLRIAAGAFGAAPTRPILLGARALVLLDDARCVKLTGGRLALAPLAALACGVAIAPVAPPGAVALHAVALDGQVALDVAGLPVAAAHPTHATEAQIGEGAIQALAETFPPIAEGRPSDPAAIPCLTPAEARALAQGGPPRVFRVARLPA